MSKNQTMKELPLSERPYEKCLTYGPEYLTDAELLAVVLRTGSRGVTSVELASELLRQCPYADGIPGLFHLSLARLQKIPGIGKVKAVQLKCICEISRRIARETSLRKLDVNSPATVANYYMETLRHEEQEMVFCMMLDGKGRYISDACIFRGTVNASLVSPRELFIPALEQHAVNIILVHNHPSGDPLPSEEDFAITNRLIEAGDLIGIHLLDHVIIGDNNFFSMKEYYDEMPVKDPDTVTDDNAAEMDFNQADA